MSDRKVPAKSLGEMLHDLEVAEGHVRQPWRRCHPEYRAERERTAQELVKSVVAKMPTESFERAMILLMPAAVRMANDSPMDFMALISALMANVLPTVPVSLMRATLLVMEKSKAGATPEENTVAFTMVDWMRAELRLAKAELSMGPVGQEGAA